MAAHPVGARPVPCTHSLLGLRPIVAAMLTALALEFSVGGHVCRISVVDAERDVV